MEEEEEKGDNKHLIYVYGMSQCQMQSTPRNQECTQQESMTPAPSNLLRRHVPFDPKRPGLVRDGDDASVASGHYAGGV